MNRVRYRLLVVALCCAALALGSLPARADSYLTLNGGVFVPQGDVDDLDSGPTVNVVYGFSLVPMLWAEVGAGYAKAEKGDVTLEVIPVTLNGKFRLPIPVVKPYALAGVGAYRTSVDWGSDDEQEIAFGYQAGVGVDFMILMVKVNVEAEYFRTEPKFGSDTVDVRGVLATVGAGFEF